MTERELLEAVLQQVDAYASAMPPPNNWTPQFRSLVIFARHALVQIDMDADALSRPTPEHKEE